MDDMLFPNFPGKQTHEALFTPLDVLVYQRARGLLGDVVAPTGVVMCYRQSLLRDVLAKEDAQLVAGAPGGLRVLRRTEGRVGICGEFGIGAPAASVVLEELIALGVQEVITVGTAGGLQPRSGPGTEIGDVVVCDRAIRDEGVSHHYLPAEREASASLRLTARLRTALRAAAIPHAVGMTWTTDAPYRETIPEIRHYQANGVLTVEIEAAALLAVAIHRGVDLACAFVLSDSLADVVWDPQFDAPATTAGLRCLLAAAVTALECKPTRGPDSPAMSNDLSAGIHHD